LLQRALSVTTREDIINKTLSITLSQDPLPHNFSGIYLTHAQQVNSVTLDFAEVLLDYSNQKPIDLAYTGCDGSCSTFVLAAGFDVQCSTSLDPYVNVTVDDVDESWQVGAIGASAGTRDQSGLWK
jgi:hypothetical protein